MLRGKANPKLLSEGAFQEGVTLFIICIYTHSHTHTQSAQGAGGPHKEAQAGELAESKVVRVTAGG